MQEIDQVMHAASRWNQRCATAMVVDTRGSSYRRPGALMLIGEDGTLVGALSGGCIESEILRRSRAVFETGEPVVVAYDGRYTLGCNGTIYILIELFEPEQAAQLFDRYFAAFRERQRWRIVSGYGEDSLGTTMIFGDDRFPVSSRVPALPVGTKSVLTLTVQPSRRLLVFGSEMDAIKLATLATETGYLTTLYGHPRNPDVAAGHADVRTEIVSPENLLASLMVDNQTAVVLMTHSYSRDLGYLEQLLSMNELPYLGLVGPKARTDELLSDLVERGVAMPDWLDSSLHAPAGLDIGGEIPAQVSMAVLAEIQMIFSGYDGGRLTDKRGPIHDPVIAG